MGLGMSLNLSLSSISLCAFASTSASVVAESDKMRMTLRIIFDVGSTPLSRAYVYITHSSSSIVIFFRLLLA